MKTIIDPELSLIDACICAEPITYLHIYLVNLFDGIIMMCAPLQ